MIKLLKRDADHGLLFELPFRGGREAELVREDRERNRIRGVNMMKNEYSTDWRYGTHRN